MIRRSLSAIGALLLAALGGCGSVALAKAVAAILRRRHRQPSARLTTPSSSQ